MLGFSAGPLSITCSALERSDPMDWSIWIYTIRPSASTGWAPPERGGTRGSHVGRCTSLADTSCGSPSTSYADQLSGARPKVLLMLPNLDAHNTIC